MFGGEFCDGEGTTVYNDLFRWNVEKGGGEWYVLTHFRTCLHHFCCTVYKKYYGVNYSFTNSSELLFALLLP